MSARVEHWEVTPEQLEEIELLNRRIEQSGLSARRFAMEVLRRDERTIRRWIDGQNPIPKQVLEFLENPTAAPWPLIPEATVESLRARLSASHIFFLETLLSGPVAYGDSLRFVAKHQVGDAPDDVWTVREHRVWLDGLAAAGVIFPVEHPVTHDSGGPVEITQLGRDFLTYLKAR